MSKVIIDAKIQSTAYDKISKNFNSAMANHHKKFRGIPLQKFELANEVQLRAVVLNGSDTAVQAMFAVLTKSGFEVKIH